LYVYASRYMYVYIYISVWINLKAGRTQSILSTLFEIFNYLKNAVVLTRRCNLRTLMVTAATLLLLRVTCHYDHVCRDNLHLLLSLYISLLKFGCVTTTIAHFIELGNLSLRNLIFLKS